MGSGIFQTFIWTFLVVIMIVLFSNADKEIVFIAAAWLIVVLTISIVKINKNLIKDNETANEDTRIVNNFLRTSWFAGLGYIILVLLLLYMSSCDSDKYKSILQALPPIGIFLSAMIASASLMKSIQENRKLKNEDKANETSKFYLEKSLAGLEIVYDYLKDKCNDHIIWIQAARTLLSTLKLKEKITSPEHKEFYEIKEYEYRHKLTQALTTDSNMNSLNVAFFYGQPDWEKMSKEEAAIQFYHSSATAYLETDDVPDYEKKVSYLNEKSIRAIFDFIQFPNTFVDGLDNYKYFKDDESIDMWVNESKNVREGAGKFFKYNRIMQKLDRLALNEEIPTNIMIELWGADSLKEYDPFEKKIKGLSIEKKDELIYSHLNKENEKFQELLNSLLP